VIQHIDIAERTSKNINKLDYKPINNVVSDEQLSLFLNYIEFARDIATVIPGFSTSTLAVQLYPGQELKGGNY
jgi:hypothetical protein